MHVESYASLVVGTVALIYWARVIRLVLKARRKHGESANFVPPEKLGRALRMIWIPAVCGWIVVPLVMAFLPSPPAALQRLWDLAWLRGVGAVIAVIGLVLTWICWRKMGRSWRMGINPSEKTQLVVTGPYAYLRHPIYALSTLIMLATVVAAPSLAMLVCAIIHLLFLQWEARREERYLISVHGEIYGRYRRAVGGFLPRSLHPHQPENG